MKSILFGLVSIGLILLIFSLSEKDIPQSSFAQSVANTSDQIKSTSDKHHSSVSIKSNPTTKVINSTL